MPKLYIVGTPIGNLGDMSPRGAETLQNVDFIAAEDTRVTAKLLNHFGIKKPMVSFFEHNMREKSPQILARIENGESCALVSDAGMPCISDPGRLLVDEAHIRGVEIESVPSATAVATAVALCGLDCSRFCFEGFLSVNKKSRFEHLSQLVDEPRACVFYEAPHKLARTLADMLSALGSRQIALVKELTKLHESVWRGSLADAAQLFGEENKPRGEYVIVVMPREKINIEWTLEQAVEHAKALRGKGTPATSAAKEAAARFGFAKNEIYKQIV